MLPSSTSTSVLDRCAESGKKGQCNEKFFVLDRPRCEIVSDFSALSLQ
jgi:hypothetical protein